MPWLSHLGPFWVLLSLKFVSCKKSSDWPCSSRSSSRCSLGSRRAPPESAHSKSIKEGGAGAGGGQEEAEEEEEETHPADDHEDEGEHHGSLHAVVPVRGRQLRAPVGPAAEHHHRPLPQQILLVLFRTNILTNSDKSGRLTLMRVTRSRMPEMPVRQPRRPRQHPWTYGYCVKNYFAP